MDRTINFKNDSFQLKFDSIECQFSGIFVIAFDLDSLIPVSFLKEDTKAQLLVKIFNNMTDYLRYIEFEKYPRIGTFFYRSSCNQTR